MFRVHNYMVTGNKGDWVVTEVRVHGKTKKDGTPNEKVGQEYDGETNYFGRMYQVMEFLKNCMIGQENVDHIKEIMALVHQYGKELKVIADNLEVKCGNCANCK